MTISLIRLPSGLWRAVLKRPHCVVTLHTSTKKEALNAVYNLLNV